uniref:Synaptopodin-2-like n=1 Tax=Gouania willdenowi TaxID=441366 RepID=A0A8C5I5V5_GOUWI
MGTGDYICVTLRGGAPWGFTIREGEGDTYVPLLVTQVEENGHAFLAGVQEGDELVSINGEPCADLTVSQAFSLIDASIACLQLLVKRFHSIQPEQSRGEGASSVEFVESTTLRILPSKQSSQIQRKLYKSDSLDETCHEDGNPKLIWTQLHDNNNCQELVFQENDKQTQRCLSPGAMVEVQVSLTEQTLDDVGCASLGSAHGIEGEKVGGTIHVTTASQYVPSSVREPLGQHGVVVSSAVAPGPGRGIESGGSQSEGEGGGQCEGPPRSFTVSFEVPSEEGPQAEEQDSDSEGDPDKPNKHHARHARLRRSESLSEKQVKEAKSKCKRIALLLTAAPPNLNNKGLLMFKKHRQRAKKYTLVSFGTGEDEQEYSDTEDEESGDEKQEIDTVKFTLIAGNNSEIEKHFLSDANSSKGVVASNWDKGLLEITRNLENQTEMESLPETKGKGALMFAQRRQRMDEIAAEHEELRRQGIPVESVQETEKKTVERSYMQSTAERHGYMDINVHQKSQQQYQQHQERQYFEQQQNYHQQQEQQYQQYQQEQYNQSQYQQQQQQQQLQQQQMYQQQQEYQQQMQHYSTNVNNSAVQHQTTEMQSSYSNRSAKPFYAENIASTPFSHVMSGTNQESMGQGEQIASRDERISTPAIKTGFLMDTRKKNTGKPMFTFKEAPKMSPNPELLNLLNRSNKKLGCESGPEEDYLSLGAEACNFLQSHGKHKIPPPVAPKPAINPNCPPWSPSLQSEATNQDMPQCAENNLPTPAVVSTTENIPGPDLEPAPAAPAPAPASAPEPSPPPATQEIPASTTTAEQQTWAHQQAESQQQFLQVASQEARGHADSKLQNDPAPVPNWGSAQTQEQQPPSSWQQAPVQTEQPQSQAPQQLPWVTCQYTQNQAQLQASSTTWNSKNQQSWTQDHEQTHTSVKEPWAQYHGQTQPQSQVQPPWAHPNEQPHSQMIQPSWGQPQESVHSPRQNLGPQPLQVDNQQQHPWVQQIEKPPQAQPPWIQPVQQETQHQPSWAQQTHQDLQQTWPHTQTSSQPQPPWVPAQPQQQQQPSMATWAPPQPQAQTQPPWMQGHTQSPVQPQANLNPWAPVPPQAQSQTQWAQPPPEHHSFPQGQSPASSQPPWTQPVPSQTVPQPQWQQRPPNTPPQPPMNAWSPAETQPQAPVNPWAPQSRQSTETVSLSTTNTRPSPKPWHTPKFSPQNRIPPLPPQRMHSSSPINPMATVLNPSSSSAALQMPVVRGKGADMFAKRQSRMEKFVVDSETVEANKASRSTSPAASLPNEWKYTPNVTGRSHSLVPRGRAPFTGQKSASGSSSPRPSTQAYTAHSLGQKSWLDKSPKPLTPWEAASRHPLGLVDEAFAFQSVQQNLALNVNSAAQRKLLPKPPLEWKAKVSYQAPQKMASQTWSQSRSPRRAPIPSFVPQTRGSVPVHSGYNSLPRQWQNQRSNLGPPVSSYESKKPLGPQSYKSVYTSNTLSWRR